MGFLEIINRKKINIAITIIAVVCILCVTTGNGIAMSRAECKHLRTDIRALRTGLQASRFAIRDLLDSRARAQSDAEDKRLRKQLLDLSEAIGTQTDNLRDKEATWDRECRRKLFLDAP